MKILYLVHQFYPEFYFGTEKFTLNMASMMQRLGHEVKIITYSFHKKDKFIKSFGNILLREYYYKGIPIIGLRHKKFPLDLELSLSDNQMSYIAHEIIKKEQPDLIHVAHPMRITEFIHEANRQNVPYVFTLTDFLLFCAKGIMLTSNNELCTGACGGSNCSIHCPELPNESLVERIRIASDILVKAKTIVSPSQFVANMFHSQFNDINVKVIHHGMSYSNIKTNKKNYQKGDPITFAFAGTLAQHKGPDILVKAFLKLESESAKLKLFGSGNKYTQFYENSLKELASGDSRIEFCGVYHEDEIGDIFSKVDVVVVPSIWYENHPLVLHEALACNVPVIASNCGGMAEKISDGYNGFTFNNGDIDKLSKILNSIIDDPEQLNHIKQNKIDKIIPTIEDECYQYEHIYKEIKN